MKAIDIDRVRSLLGLAKAFTLQGEPVINRRKLTGSARPQKQRAAARAWNRANRKRKKRALTERLDKARIERREQIRAASTWGATKRSFRSMAQLVAHREAIRQAFEAKPVLRCADLIPLVGKNRWRQDVKWMIDNGLCTVRLEQTDGTMPWGRLHGKKRIFARTAKPWIEWKPYHLHASTYEAKERAANDYLD